jgi:glycosyltransferase involved in cell wall biosynthesis
VAAEDPHVCLVVAGPDGWGLDAFESAWARARSQDRIARLGYVGAPARADLLAGATALAYPSLEEGFGLPPLEAMTLGVPVVASTDPAIRDVLGEAAAVLVDATDVAAIAAGLRAVLTDDALRARLANAGPARAARYSWPRAARAFVQLYERLAATAV